MFPCNPTMKALLLAASLLVYPASAANTANTIRAKDYARLHALIKPQPGESKWARIPWLTDLSEARKRAVAEDKPLLLWRSGGGDVLGRT
jgi:hypothetical protein